MSRRKSNKPLAEKRSSDALHEGGTTVTGARSLPARPSLQVLVEELDALSLDALEQVPDVGKRAFVFPVSNLRVGFGNLVKDLLSLDSAHRDNIFHNTEVMLRAAFLIGHHGPPSANAVALTRRMGAAKARSSKIDPGKNAAIEAAIDKHLAEWDGSNPTKMSLVISVELENSQLPYRMTPRGIRNRLKKRGFDGDREA